MNPLRVPYGTIASSELNLSYSDLKSVPVQDLKWSPATNTFSDPHTSHLFKEIKFKDHGAESFEVIDNGHGIDPKNYEGLGGLSPLLIHLNHVSL